MRSRNGNSLIVRCIYALVIFQTLLLGDAYRISYKLVTRDAVILNETLTVAKAMSPCRGGIRSDATLVLGYPPHSRHTVTLKAVLEDNFDLFLRYISRLGLFVKDRQKLSSSTTHATTSLIFPSTCFKVDFNDSFVTITAIK